MHASDNSEAARTIDRLLVFGLLSVSGAAFFIFSQGPYSHGDEGFHLLTSQLINLGKRPYLDFFYQHAPLYVCVNAAWLSIFGNTWRSAHVFSALLTVTCAALIGGFFYTRVPGEKWRLACAAIAPILFLSNVLVTRFAVLAQPYGWCLCFEMAAFLLTLRTVEQSGSSAVWAGLCAGATTTASLLTLPIGPMLFFWTATQVPKNDRARKLLQFSIGAAVAFLPVLAFASIAPRQMFWDVIAYHFTFRYAAPVWPGQDFATKAGSLLGSTQGMLLVVLLLIGVAFALSNAPQLASRWKSSLLLCTVVGLVLTLFACTIRPLVRQYFVLITPFVIILACSGLYAVGALICSKWYATWLIAVVMTMFLLEGARTARDQFLHPIQSWNEDDQVAALINRVIPQGCPIYTEDAAVYVAAKRIPPNGLENNYSSYLDLNPSANKLLHIIPQEQIDNLVRAGQFTGVVAWSPGLPERLHLSSLYKDHRYFRAHQVFWNWAGSIPQSSIRELTELATLAGG